MWDPLNFGQEFYKNYKLMKRMCNEQEDDWQSQKLVEVMQEKQDAWFATWAGEMIRIAKPGSSVIVEEISLPLCEAPTGWGGVPKDFWEQAISKYKWDVDPSSIAFGSRKEGSERRYHVFMQKNF